jgi:hypothetical protein
MTRHIASVALLSLSLISFAREGSSAEYRAPLPFGDMYDRLQVGMGWRQAHEITRAPELEREPTDLEITDLLRLDFANRRCHAELVRLHWYKGRLHWIEHFQLEPTGVTYRDRGDPDPIGDALVRRLTETSAIYAAEWDRLTGLIAAEGPPSLRARVEQATNDLKRRLDALRQDRPK